MSLGITQLKAPASKKWSCPERLQEKFPEKSAYCLFALLLSAGGGQHRGLVPLQIIQLKHIILTQ